MTQPPRAQLVIQLTTDGGIQVHGPVQDKILCYGLLECARDAIKAHHEQPAKSAIVPARQADPMLIDPRRNGGKAL